jgi:hypothetical protein
MHNLKRTARLTGVWYLLLGITGMIGFLIIRPQLYIADDPAATLTNLAENPSLAHLSVVLEFGIILTQAAVALWFYKLFAGINRVAAVGTMAFGLLNAAAIMASAMFMATAVAVSADVSLAPGADAAATVGLLAELSKNAWGVGNLFFGLWLIPMGWVVVTSGRMPRVMGWILIAGGIGYVLSGILNYGIVDAPTPVVDGLAYLATVGEFWMIGYLLIFGIRPEGAGQAPATAERNAAMEGASA